MFPVLILLIALIGVTALAQSGLVAFIYPIQYANILTKIQITSNNSWVIFLVFYNYHQYRNFFYRVFFNSPDNSILHYSTNWISTGNFNIDLGVSIDNMTAIMLVVVSLVSCLVHLYSSEYMKGDSRFSRYYAFLGLFTFSMNGIVLGDSIAMIYIFALCKH